MCKCKFMKQGKCSNENSLFLGYNAVWCRVCKLNEPVKCNWKIADGLCAVDLPDSYRPCEGYEKCKLYQRQVKDL